MMWRVNVGPNGGQSAAPDVPGQGIGASGVQRSPNASEQGPRPCPIAAWAAGPSNQATSTS